MTDVHLDEPPAWCVEDLSGLDDDYAADEGRPPPDSTGTPFDYTLLKDLEPNLASQFVIKDLRPMQLGENPHGEPVTAVYVEHRADSGKGKRKGRRIGPKARSAYEKLWEMIKDHSRSYPMDGSRLRCVLLNQWQDACCEQGVLGQIKDPANRRKKFYAAQEELLKQDMITIDWQNDDREDGNGRVYPTREGE